MKKMKRLLLLLIFTAILLTPLFAQTPEPVGLAEEIEYLLNAREISWARAASFVLKVSEHGNFNEADAFNFAQERRWLPRNAAPNDHARLSGVSRLLLESFGIRGGIMYSLTGSPRYAYRELVSRNIIQGRTVPSMPVSGERLLFMAGQFLDIREAEENQ